MGMDFGSGSFTARVRGEPGFQTPSIDSPEADLASFLAELAPSEFFVDLDAASAYRPLADWLDSDHEFHAVGAVWLPENHVDTHHLTQSFDGMVFVETGTPTSLRLGGPQASGDGEEDDSEDTATAG